MSELLNPNPAIERFRLAIGATMRGLSGRRQLNVSFASGKARIEGNTVSLQGPDATLQEWNLRTVRGEADALCFWLRYHDPDVYVDTSTLPQVATEWVLGAEHARVEALGGRCYAGSAKNLLAMREERVRRAGFSGFTNLRQLPPAAAFELLITAAVIGSSAGPSPARVDALWRPMLDAHSCSLLDRLASQLDEQAAFASTVTAFIETLPSDQLAQMCAAANTVPPQPSGEENMQSLITPPAANAETAVPDPRTTADSRPPRAARRTSVRERYKPFTTEYDRICSATAMASNEQLKALHAQLTDGDHGLQDSIGRLARRLRRRLLAWQRRSWMHDLEDGLLDTTRLPEIVSNPATLPPYRKVTEIHDHDTVVTLLIDNSGSMRGRPLNIAGLCADHLTRALERCGIRVEILGYTTATWKGGQSCRKWIAAGQPARPGRLNDTLHIVYKSADASWLRSRRNLGLMLRRDLPRENIDGEALLWAYDRLMSRSESRRVLIVVSDGGPADEITLSVNDPHLLSRHLQQVVALIEHARQVELLAIGIGEDACRPYRRAVSIENTDTFAVTLAREIEKLFERNAARRADSGCTPRRRSPRAPA
ncbi:MAG: cobaltochelatase subunit CobT [Betaproteobacteria bacterium]|nr:cobaltochelatase subunit CobT [Betaproteobacteria bacterium]